MGRRILAFIVPLVAVALCAWLLWDEIEASGIFEGSASDDGSDLDAALRAHGDTPALVADLRERARLRGLPGIRTAPGGTGRITGSVFRHLPGRGPAPFPAVVVCVVGVGEGHDQGWHGESETGDDGNFAIERVPALVGYAVIVDHPPFKQVVLRGITVRRDRTTDAGTILLGAPTVLTGDVVDGAGRAVPGAIVQVFFDRSRPRRMDVRRALADLQGALEPLTETRAARDGRFALENLSPGRYLVRVSAAGYATVFREGVWVTADERASDLQVVLDLGAGYEGRVVDEDGRGIAGARVIAIAFPSRASSRLDRVETVAGSDGRYRLDGLVAGTRYFVEAWAEGYAPAGRFLQPEEIGALDLALVESGRVEGRITDESTGDGIEGAEVTMVSGTLNTLSPVATVTDAAGRYAFAHMSPGPIAMFGAKADGYPVGSFDLGSSAGRRVVAGETLVVDWTLERGCVVFGRIADESGRPVPYATIAFADPRRRGEGEETALSDVDGFYRVEGLRQASYEVWITAPGYAPPTEDEDVVCEVPPGIVEIRRNFVLARGGTCRGVIRDPQGAPLGGARVEIVAQGGRRLRERVQALVAVTAPTGRWRIAGVPPRVPLVVRAAHDEWIAASSEELRLSPAETREVDLVLGAGLTLDGRVTRPGGRAVEGARVRWGPVGPDDERRVRDEFRADQLLTPRVVRTDGDGRFTLERLPPGRMLLKVEMEGYADWYRKDLVVLAEGPRPDLVVELAPASRIEGRVLDALTKQPIAEAWVYAREEKPGDDEETDGGRVRALASAQTGADGRYVLEGLAPGPHEVVVWLALGYRAETQDNKHPSVRRHDVPAGSRRVDFELEALELPR